MAKRFQNQTEELIDTLRSGITPALNTLAKSIDSSNSNMVTSLDSTELAGHVIEAVGIPAYVSDVSDYSDYGITETGWYVFARITGNGEKVGSGTTVTGAAGYIATVGSDHIDVAVRFEVAADSQAVTVHWKDGVEFQFIFKATDLAIRNLDYRVTFYVYDAAKYVTWEYALTTDQTFQAGKNYYVSDGEGGYTLAEVQTVAYVLTSDATFQAGKTYCISDGQGGYTQAQVQTVAYELTADDTFQDGKTYYISDGAGGYTAATVTAGEAITADTYYEQTTVPVPANTYYEQTTVPVPADTYYNHSKCIISGLIRNITYKLDEIIDCPMEFILPEIEDESHGCWFEIRCRHAGEYSMTLTPPSADVKIATEHTQKETAGINMINLHYTVIDGLKIWRFLNTHSSIPTT